jgi:hypothetical protein
MGDWRLGKKFSSGRARENFYPKIFAGKNLLFSTAPLLLHLPATKFLWLKNQK